MTELILAFVLLLIVAVAVGMNAGKRMPPIYYIREVPLAKLLAEEKKRKKHDRHAN